MAEDAARELPNAADRGARARRGRAELRHGRRGARRPTRAVVTFDSCGVFVRRTATKTRRCAQTAPARWPSCARRRTRSAASAERPPNTWLLVPRAAVVASAHRSVQVRGVSTSVPPSRATCGSRSARSSTASARRHHPTRGRRAGRIGTPCRGRISLNQPLTGSNRARDRTVHGKDDARSDGNCHEPTDRSCARLFTPAAGCPVGGFVGRALLPRPCGPVSLV